MHVKGVIPIIYCHLLGFLTPRRNSAVRIPFTRPLASQAHVKVKVMCNIKHITAATQSLFCIFSEIFRDYATGFKVNSPRRLSTILSFTSAGEYPTLKR
jgi:hypothetical protein